MKKSEYYQQPWYFQGEILEDIPEDSFGFVYLIEHIEKPIKYIGRKQILTFNKRGVVTGESNWRTYFSSSKEIRDMVKESGYEKWRRTILEFAYTKRHLTYLETKYLFQYEVLESEQYLNKNILGKFYRGNLK